jgi:hypothetical protein
VLSVQCLPRPTFGDKGITAPAITAMGLVEQRGRGGLSTRSRGGGQAHGGLVVAEGCRDRRRNQSADAKSVVSCSRETKRLHFTWWIASWSRLPRKFWRMHQKLVCQAFLSFLGFYKQGCIGLTGGACTELTGGTASLVSYIYKQDGKLTGGGCPHSAQRASAHAAYLSL